LPREISEGILNTTDYSVNICNYKLNLKLSEVITETATTIEPHFTLDLPNIKRFYKQKRKQLKNLNPLCIN